MVDVGSGRSWGEPERRLRHLSVGLTILFLLGAWQLRFVQDDAFISFRYAENWARGLGPVWNPGERVEGYTNFLWTALLAAGFRLGLDPIPLSWGLGLACFLGSLACVRSIVTRLAGPRAALLAVLLTGTNYSFLAYATGGLETSMQAAFALLLLALALPALSGVDALSTAAPGSRRTVDPRGAEAPASRVDLPEAGAGSGRLALVSTAAALNVLGRLDSAIFAGIVLGAVALRFARRGGPRSPLLLTALLAPAALITSIWLAWRAAYYGDLLPNTFYVKVSGVGGAKMGLEYTWTFLTHYSLWLPLAVGGVYLAANLARFTAWERAAALIAGVWIGYVTLIGGDFMEFRFFVPILPIVMILLTMVAWRSALPRLVTLAAAGSLAVSSVAHAVSFKGSPRIESVRSLERHLYDPSQDWVGIGRRLAEAFGPDSRVKVAVTAAGAIPFYSKLPAVDMLGLSDRWIAKHGRRAALKPGHARWAPLGYLVERGVNLMIAHPEVIPEGEAADWTAERFREHLRTAWFLDPSSPRTPPPGSRGLLMPLGGGRLVAIYYLVRTPEVDEAIRRDGWRSVPLT